MTVATAHNLLQEHQHHIIQGEYYVSNQPDVVLSTILGSCVAACIRDPETGIGGMNHFLLPGEGLDVGAEEAVRYGVHAMETLVNALLQNGARRDRLEAKLFGGANLIKAGVNIGSQNAEFAERFVRHEGFRFVSASLRGSEARRLLFWPVSGRVCQMLLKGKLPEVRAASRPDTAEQSNVELFI